MMAPFLKLPIRHRSRPEDLPGVIGAARLDRRTKNLTKRLRTGEIAIIDHADLDRLGAEALLRQQVAAVVNVAPSISGRYPNLGPQLLVEAGVPLVDDVGPDVFTKVSEGTLVRLQGDTLYVGDEVVAKGRVQTAGMVAEAMTAAKEGIAAQLQDFVTNTLEYVKGEGAAAGRRHRRAGPADQDRGAARRWSWCAATGSAKTLRCCAPYIREFKPVMVGVDGGADALLEAGYLPDIIVGDMDSVTDDGLHCGAELVVHAYRSTDGRPARSGSNGSGCPRWSVPPAAPVRMWPC